MTIQFDTSGFVPMMLKAGRDANWYADKVGYEWSNLTPFQQGYVEAMVDSISPGTRNFPGFQARGYRPAGFSDIAPETLQRIIEDCERITNNFRSFQTSHVHGARIWHDRQANGIAVLPPLTITLSDDGKIRLTEQVSV